MEKQGLQEDPKYFNLIALRARHTNMEQHPRTPAQVENNLLYNPPFLQVVDYLIVAHVPYNV